MSFEITRDESIDVTRISFAGHVDHDQLLESVRLARELPSHNYRTLLVAGPDTEIDLSSHDLRSIARALRDERAADAPRGQTAIVAPTSLVFGLARMTQVFMEEGPAEVRVFQTDAEAAAWLVG